jgi:hypothetical protein
MQRRQQRKAQEIMSETKQFKQISKHKAHEDAYLAQMTHATSLQCCSANFQHTHHQKFQVLQRRTGWKVYAPARGALQNLEFLVVSMLESFRPSHRSGYEI